MMNKQVSCLFCVLITVLCLEAGAQTRASPKLRPSAKLDPKQQFVVDVVSAAVSVPQPEPVDRLRVLAAASSVVMPLRPAMAREFSREGLRIEQETIQRGVALPTSMLTSGPVDCSAVRSFAENVPVNRVDVAETTLIAAVDRCPRLSQTIQRLITSALEKRIVAPRLTMAVIEQVGVGTEWAQKTIDDLYSVLPPPTRSNTAEAPNLAAMYSQVAGQLPPDATARAGVRLLTWLSKMDPGKKRNLAVNVTTGAMKERLGAEAYARALASDIGALEIAQTAGQAGDIERPAEESVSVLRAMHNADADRTDELRNMSASLRAREAAASGFAAGTGGKGRLAEHYFDIAFSALEDVWSGRERQADAANVVQEVSEAAAHVDAISALQRSQRLQDPAAQAIGMIAVARVVANQ